MTWFSVRPVWADIKKSLWYCCLGAVLGGYASYSITSSYYQGKENEKAKAVYHETRPYVTDHKKIEILEEMLKQ